eukprot:846958-Pyramimonas_sp.AAC.1
MPREIEAASTLLSAFSISRSFRPNVAHFAWNTLNISLQTMVTTVRSCAGLSSVLSSDEI